MHAWPDKRGHAWVTMTAASDKCSLSRLSRAHLDLDDPATVDSSPMLVPEAPSQWPLPHYTSNTFASPQRVSVNAWMTLAHLGKPVYQQTANPD